MALKLDKLGQHKANSDLNDCVPENSWLFVQCISFIKQKIEPVPLNFLTQKTGQVDKVLQA